ncbi:MAG: oligosaccharide flippase family protein [Planctomycetales bacterium]|nr:oligosaccharide flippase family protein [Planctomycetales bacterium]
MASYINALRGVVPQLAGDAILYGVAGGFTRVAGLFTIPLVARSLSESEFGAADSLTMLGILIGFAMTLGQDSALARLYYDCKREDEQRQLVSQSLILVGIATCLLTAITLAASGYLSSMWLNSIGFSSTFRWMVISLPFAVALQFFRNLLKWTMAKWTFNAVALITVFTTASLTVLLVVGAGMRTEGIFVAQACGSAVGATIACVACRRYLALPTGWTHLRPLCKLGLCYVVLAVGVAALPSIDRYIVGRYISATSLGLYGAGAKFVVVIMIPCQAFQIAWGPYCYSRFARQDASELFNTVLRFAIATFALIAVTFLSFREVAITLLLSSRYLAAETVVLPLLLAAIVRSVGWITGVGIDLAKRPMLSAIDIACSIAVTALLAYLLVGRFGISGVAWAVFAGQMVRTVCVSIIGQIVWPQIRFCAGAPGIAIAGTVIAGLLLQVECGGTVMTVVQRALTLLAFLVFLWAFSLTSGDRGALNRYSRSLYRLCFAPLRFAGRGVA